MSGLKTALTELVGIEHPVVQTGMGWVAGARLVAATSNAGGLGILASATMTLDELKTAVAKVKATTDKPFGINIRADAGDATGPGQLRHRRSTGDRRHYSISQNGSGLGAWTGADGVVHDGARGSAGASRQARAGGVFRCQR